MDTSDSHLKVVADYEAGTELVAKVQVMAKYPSEQKIAIGDSITDLNMGLQAFVLLAIALLSI